MYIKLVQNTKFQSFLIFLHNYTLIKCCIYIKNYAQMDKTCTVQGESTLKTEMNVSFSKAAAV